MELVGEAQARTAPASAAAPSQRVSQAPWPLILAIATFVVDIIAVFAGYYLSKNLLSAWKDTSTSPHITWIYATVAIWPVVFAVYGLYDLRRPTHATAEFRRLFNGAVMAVLLVALITIEVDPHVSASSGFILGRGFIPTLLVVCLVSVVAGRLVR
jgi:CDP-diglyceride synthetase